mgnify:CR=1 FL=1
MKQVFIPKFNCIGWEFVVDANFKHEDGFREFLKIMFDDIPALEHLRQTQVEEENYEALNAIDAEIERRKS